MNAALRLPCGHLHTTDWRGQHTVTCAHDGRRFEIIHRPGRWEAREEVGE